MECPRESDFGTNPHEVFVLAHSQGAGVQVVVWHHLWWSSTKGRAGYQLGLFQPCWQAIWG